MKICVEEVAAAADRGAAGEVVGVKEMQMPHF